MAVPGIPTNLYVQEGNSQVYLLWDVTPTATSYSVERSLDGSSYSVVGTPSAPSYLDSTVTVGTTYYYKVAGVNGSGTGTYTAAQTIVPTLTAQMSLAQVRLSAQQRADRVNSNFVTLPEWNSYINQSRFELYDMLVTLYEDYYVAPAYTITTTGTNLYDLPSDLYKLIGVDCGVASSTNAWVTIKKFDFIARNRYIYPQITSTYLGVFNLQYRMLGSKIELIPTPSSGQYIRLWYVPKLSQLLQETDTMDGISGWTEYVIVDAAIKALQKEESDVSALMVQKQALVDRIDSSAMNRDAGQPDTVSDTRTWSEKYGSFGGPGMDGGWGGN